MPYQNILVEAEGPVLTVTVNRPRKLNALNRQTVRELARAFAFPALEKRYDGVLALFITASLTGIIFFSPVLLLAVFGLGLTELFRRRRNGLTPLVAMVVFHLGLVMSVSFSPWIRSLFLV